MTDALPIAPIEPAEQEAFWRASFLPFAEDVDEAHLALARQLSEPDRTFAARDGGDMVAFGAAQAMPLSLPGGGEVPMAGVTLIAVQPTHRRRGLAGRLLQTLHRQAAERGEPLAGLMASEGAIYDNFGYGVGAHERWVDVDLPRARLRPEVPREPGVRFASVEQAVTVAVDVYERLRADVAGMPRLDPRRLRILWGHDDPSTREGASPRYLVVTDDGRGVAVYRVKADWQHTGPQHTAILVWLMATDPAVEARLWRFVSELDLVRRVEAWRRPVDDLLPWLLTDGRLAAGHATDGLWLRVLDPAAVLSARQASGEGRVVVSVVDPDGFADGRFVVEGDGGRLRCEPTTSDTAEATVPAASLATAVLGDTRLTLLARAGRADEHTPGALRTLDRLLGVDRAPWCPFEIA